MLSNRRHRRNGFARAFAAFALLAMVVRALVPAGYMVAPAQAGQPSSIILCSAYGAVSAHVDSQTGALVEDQAGSENKAPARSHGGDHCAFAGVAHLSTPEAAAALFASSQTLPALALDARSHESGLAAPPPWSTGPPNLQSI